MVARAEVVLAEAAVEAVEAVEAEIIILLKTPVLLQVAVYLYYQVEMGLKKKLKSVWYRSAGMKNLDRE